MVLLRDEAADRDHDRRAAQARAPRRAGRAPPPRAASAPRRCWAPPAAALPAARPRAAPPRGPPTRRSRGRRRAAAGAAARYSACRTPWNVASTGGRRGPRPSRATRAPPARRRAGCARARRAGGRAGSRPRGSPPPRPTPAGERPRSATTTRSSGAPSSSGSSAPAGPHNDDLVPALRQRPRERDHDPLSAADVGARRGEEDPHRASRSSYSASVRSTIASAPPVRLDVARARPRPGRRASAGSSSRRAIAAASAAGSPGATSWPVPVGDELRHAADARRHHRHAGRHRLQQRERRVLHPRGQHEHGEAGERVARRHVAGEADRAVQPERARTLAQGRGPVSPRRTARSAPPGAWPAAPSPRRGRRRGPLTGCEARERPHQLAALAQRPRRAARRWGSP